MSLAVLAPLAAAELPLQPLDLDRGASGLALALRRLGVSGRVLFVTAHPDDEHNGMLVRLSRGLGLRTGLLTLTRGEGGQNAIGPELFEALGVLRTGELSALHRHDGAVQYFGRAYEFGFSFSVEETLAKWGREETLGDVVRVVRAFRPDVILTLPLEGEGGGQHHQAAGRLAREAFRAAGDPARFPDQLREGLRPWQARKIYQGGVGGFGEVPGTPVRVPTGVYDPVLGMTWQQLGSRARAMHRCQGAGQLVADPGPAEGVFSLLDAQPAVAAPESDILDGIDTTLAGLAGGWPGVASGAAADITALQARMAAARAAFDPGSPENAVPALADALVAVRSLAQGIDGRVADPAARAEIAERLKEEEGDVEAALALAQGLVLEARADDGLVTPGQTVGVAVTLFNDAGTGPRGGGPRRRGACRLDRRATGRRGGFAARGRRASGPIRGPGRARRAGVAALLAAVGGSGPAGPPRPRGRDAPLEPACPRRPGPLPRERGRDDPAHAGRLAVRGAVRGRRATVRGAGRALAVGAGVAGDRGGAARLSSLAGRGARLRPPLRAGCGRGHVRLEAPPGWSVEPKSAALRFAYEGEEAGMGFRATPPAVLAAGAVGLRAVAVEQGREHRETVQAVEYDHVERRQLLRPAETRVLALDVRTAAGASVGYVMGSGDAVAEAIQQMGIPLVLLSANDLLFGDLSRFSTILTGIRAYETRPDLRSSHGRLMRWVEAGGHLVVQYNRAAFNRVAPEARALPAESSSPYAPFPAAVTSERISDETAPLRVLVPGHLLTTPNPIGEGDWAGWVQERGIQFLAARDPRYMELLAGTDPFPYNPGEKRGILVEAKVGKGTWTYVGLALFRQVPAGVPGGWRLLANLVSR